MLKEGKYLEIHCAHCDGSSWQIPVMLGNQEKRCSECGEKTVIEFRYDEEHSKIMLNTKKGYW